MPEFQKYIHITMACSAVFHMFFWLKLGFGIGTQVGKNSFLAQRRITSVDQRFFGEIFN